MKRTKIICLLLAAMMLLGLCACGNQEDAKAFYGTWVFTENLITLVIKDDGTADYISRSSDGTVEDEFDSLKYTVSGGTLTIDRIDVTATMNADGTLEVKDLGSLVKQS